jgi:hypothetical protein
VKPEATLHQINQLPDQISTTEMDPVSARIIGVWEVDGGLTIGKWRPAPFHLGHVGALANCRTVRTSLLQEEDAANDLLEAYETSLSDAMPENRRVHDCRGHRAALGSPRTAPRESARARSHARGSSRPASIDRGPGNERVAPSISTQVAVGRMRPRKGSDRARRVGMSQGGTRCHCAS